MPGYDVIGDIHGHADALEALLHKLGYRERSGAWRQAGRQALFLGDFVDRGPRQLDTVDIARRMVDAGSAVAIQGNHEFNAIMFATRGPDGRHLRVRGSRNALQHKAFLDAVSLDSPLHRELIDWFATLPLWIEIPGVLRAVHACWDGDAMEVLSSVLDDSHRMVDTESIVALGTRGEAAYEAAERVLKGVEAAFPPEVEFRDKDGIRRLHGRLRWWDSEATTYRKAFVDRSGDVELPDVETGLVPVKFLGGPPVFFGHYWLTGTPHLLSQHATCLDFSVASDGVLTSYSHDGEPELLPEKLSWVAATPASDVEPVMAP